MSVEQITQRCEELYRDLDLRVVKQWKAKAQERRAIGYLPIYVPREIIHAAGMLPVGIMGAGDQLEIIRGDSYFQSYICHLPRSVVELAVSGRFDCLDGFLFPSICDVVRNLSGMFKVLFANKYVKYFDAPQNFESSIGGRYYTHELQTLCRDLEQLNGVAVTTGRLNNSIGLHNENRRLVMQLYALRSDEPWQVPTSECYLLLRAGNLLPVEEHNELLRAYLNEVPRLGRRMLDNSRIVLTGAFCEQPPLGLIRTLERAGCDIVNDDLLLISRWYLEPVPISTDPIASLVNTFLEHSTYTAAKYDHQNNKGDFLIDTVRRHRADGVIFCAPSFCDPALLDQPMLIAALDRAGISHTHFKYSENSGQFQVIREQAGTFADSIKLWGGT